MGRKTKKSGENHANTRTPLKHSKTPQISSPRSWMIKETMIDESYGIRNETIASIGEFTINWNLFEKYYCHNNASEQKIINLDLNPFSEMRTRMNAFREKLIDHFNRHNMDFTDAGLQAVLFTDNRKLNYKERIRDFLENPITICIME